VSEPSEQDEPRYTFEIVAPDGIRRNEVLSVGGRELIVGKRKDGGRNITLKGPATTVTIYLPEEIAAKLKEGL